MSLVSSACRSLAASRARVSMGLGGANAEQDTAGATCARRGAPSGAPGNAEQAVTTGHHTTKGDCSSPSSRSARSQPGRSAIDVSALHRRATVEHGRENITAKNPLQNGVPSSDIACSSWMRDDRCQ
eukprot:2016540-Rhodomonas_salina.1